MKMRVIQNCTVEIDSDRGVIYVHTEKGYTVLRVSGLLDRTDARSTRLTRESLLSAQIDVACCNAALISGTNGILGNEASLVRKVLQAVLEDKLVGVDADLMDAVEKSALCELRSVPHPLDGESRYLVFRGESPFPDVPTDEDGVPVTKGVAWDDWSGMAREILARIDPSRVQ